MTHWNLLIAIFISGALQLGCGEDLDNPTDSDEISELADTTQLNELIDTRTSTLDGKQIVTFTNLNQYEKPDVTTCYPGFGPEWMPNCTGSVAGCTEPGMFGDGICDGGLVNLNCAATGWDGGDCANASRDEVQFFAYHNGCDSDAIPGLCMKEMVASGNTHTYTPSSITTSYDDIVMVFTYIAETIQAIASVALTIMTAGAASELIAAEVAEVTAEVGAEAGIDVVAVPSWFLAADAAEVGDAADVVAEGGVNISTETSSGSTELSWGEKLYISVLETVPLATIKGGLKGGYKSGLGTALIAGAESFATTLASAGVGAAAETEKVKGLLNYAKKLGRNATTHAFTAIKSMTETAEKAAGATAGRLRKFMTHLTYGGRAAEDTASYVVQETAKTLTEATSPTAVQAFLDKLDIVSVGLVSLTIVSRGNKLVLQYQDDTGIKIVPFHRGHLVDIVRELETDPNFDAKVAEYVRQNIPLERGIRSLAVAHNLWINAPTLQPKLTPLFNNEAEVSDLYKNHLPAAMLTGAGKLNTDYHLAISARDHALYARLNLTFVAGQIEPTILSELSNRDFESEGFAISAEILEAAGYQRIHKLASTETQNVQNLLLCTRIALGMPVPIKLWSDKEWDYIAGYRGKLYRNTAGFLQNGVNGGPSFGHWLAPWYAPGHPKHNTFWEEVVAYTGSIGATYEGTTTKAYPLSAPQLPLTQGISILQDHHLHMEVNDITDDELAKWNAPGSASDGCGSDRDSLIIVTLKAARAVNWWKGLNIETNGYDATTCRSTWTSSYHDLEVKADGAPMTLHIPVADLKQLISTLEPSQPPGFRNAITSAFKFKVKNNFGVQYSIGETKYSLESLVGKHISVTWVTDSATNPEEGNVPGRYDVRDDGVSIVTSTQAALPSSKASHAEIAFEVNTGITWFKEIFLKKSNGTYLKLSSHTGTTTLSSSDPETEWGYYVHVELWEEMTPGVNYFQKSIKIKTSDLVGHKTTFKWMNDGTNFGTLASSYKVDGGRNQIDVQTEPLPEVIVNLPGFETGISEVAFEVAPGITWWKGVTLRGKDGSQATLEIEGCGTGCAGTWVARNLNFIAITPIMLNNGNEVVIEFWEVKFAGVEWHVGTAKINFEDIKNKKVTFTWLTDS